jgi:hypothetical protein
MQSKIMAASMTASKPINRLVMFLRVSRPCTYESLIVGVSVIVAQSINPKKRTSMRKK